MESQPQNPEFRINPENFHPCNQHNKTLTLVSSMESQPQNPEFRINAENFHSCDQHNKTLTLVSS